MTSSPRYVVNYNAIFIALFFVFAVVCSANGNCKRCRSLALDGDVTGCWNQSVTYFTESLVDSISNFTTNLIYLQKLRVNQPELSDSLVHFEELIIQDVIKAYNASQEETEKPLPAQDLLDILTLVLNKTKPIQESYTEKYAPSLACPIPCDYDAMMYKILFYTMVAAFILCVASSLAFMFCVHRRTDFAYVKTFGGKKRNRFV